MSIKFATPAPKALQLAAAVLHVYFLDTSKPDQAAQYAALVEGRKAAGKHRDRDQSPDTVNSKWDQYYGNIDAHAGRDKFAGFGQWSAPVSVELEFVFDNQMNTAAPLHSRLFDWREIKYPNPDMKRGYYVESPELEKARANTCACGYCGKQYEGAQPGEFCRACLESPNMTIDHLHMTRLRAIADRRDTPRPPLMPEEVAELMPIFEEARTKGITERGRARLENARAGVVAEFEKITRIAALKRDAYLWLLERGVTVENVIYYDHRNIFTFGWRDHYEGAELERLQRIVADFPYPHEINPAKR